MDDASYVLEDDMEYEESASDDSSNTYEEVMKDDVLGVAAGQPGEAWQDVDEEMDDEEGPSNDNSDEEQDAECNEDEEILLQASYN